MSVAFAATTSSTPVYEIAPPPGVPQFYDAIAMKAAIRMTATKGMAASETRALALEYKASVKALRDALKSKAGRVPLHYERNTWDNPDNKDWNVWHW